MTINNVVVGKHTLESLTTGMYTNPFIIYREYIQNSTDAIDEAVRKGIIGMDSTYIKIIVDKENSTIIIEDNGVGVKAIDASDVLLNIGKSNKNPKINKGFRGIGRLGGLSYAKNVTFETSYYGEEERTSIMFDADKLSKLLVPGQYEEYSVSDVINAVTNINTCKGNLSSHYFRVILRDIDQNLNLLDVEKVSSYLRQVAPIPFDRRKFHYVNDIYKELEANEVDSVDYNIYIGTSPDQLMKLYKPYKNKFHAALNHRVIDSFTGINFNPIFDDNKKLIAVVWYGSCKLLGTVLDEEVKGLRVRKSGILVGDRFLLNSIFKEERFNGWVQGEVIILDDRVIPNARRDDFETTETYLNLIEKLKVIADTISTDIRNTSKNRNFKKNNGDKQSDKNGDVGEIVARLDTIIERSDRSYLMSEIEKILQQELEPGKTQSILAKIKKLA